ncbi:MAG: AraC family transcriptional regulator [Bacteroidota bacterium]|nr:AraC family transcriptional regulator [Bacteroidota bacterium]
MKIDKEPLNLILLNIGHSVHEADWNWKNIISPFLRIYLVVEGQAEMDISGHSYTLTPGHLYLIPPFTLHSDSNNTHFSLYYLHIYEEQIKHSTLFEQLIFPFEVPASAIDNLIIQRLLEINPCKGLPIYDPKSYDNNTTLYKTIAETTNVSFPVYTETCGIIMQLFSRFLAAAKSHEPSQDSRILGVLRYIREHIDKKVTITQLSSLCYLSEDHFIRLFRKEMGSTPIDYINQKKIEKAQLMLVINNLPVKDIACALSFDNVSYFNRLFKKTVGCTPSEYRGEYRQTTA